MAKDLGISRRAISKIEKGEQNPSLDMAYRIAAYYDNRVTRLFPDFEKYGLCSQFQRAAVSIPANIAEGYRRLGQADKLHFLNISQSSLEECRYYCILTRDLEYIDSQTYELLKAQVNESSFLLNSYVKGINEN